MQTAMHLEAFYVSWMSVSDKQDRQKGGQDLRRKADFEANSLVQVQPYRNLCSISLAYPHSLSCIRYDERDKAV